MLSIVSRIIMRCWSPLGCVHITVKDVIVCYNGKFFSADSLIQSKGKVQKKQGKKLTSVSFALTHTYTPVKTNIFPFFPQAYMENLAIVWEKRKKKTNISPFPATHTYIKLTLVSFFLLFFAPFP